MAAANCHSLILLSLKLLLLPQSKQLHRVNSGCVTLATLRCLFVALGVALSVGVINIPIFEGGVVFLLGACD